VLRLRKRQSLHRLRRVARLAKAQHRMRLASEDPAIEDSANASCFGRSRRRCPGSPNRRKREPGFGIILVILQRQRIHLASILKLTHAYSQRIELSDFGAGESPTWTPTDAEGRRRTPTFCVTPHDMVLGIHRDGTEGLSSRKLRFRFCARRSTMKA
jgi:hypothetical protein